MQVSAALTVMPVDVTTAIPAAVVSHQTEGKGTLIYGWEIEWPPLTNPKLAPVCPDTLDGV